jgi:Fe-S cluster biogenesis protein NfuA
MAEPLAELDARIARLDGLLAQLEQTPGATATLALEAVQALTEVYGAALARVVDLAPPALLEAFDRDELLRHLLVLHDLHPHPVEERVREALDRVRPYLHSHGGDVTLVEVAGGVARVAFTGHCDGCTSSTETMTAMIRDAVLAVAPELLRVDAEPATAAPHPAPAHSAAVIPVDALLRRPAPAS